MDFGLLRDRPILAARTAATAGKFIFLALFATIVFDKIYKIREGTVDFGLLRDRPILGPRTAATGGKLIF